MFTVRDAAVAAAMSFAAVRGAVPPFPSRK
jgi:hypothetical protein